MRTSRKTDFRYNKDFRSSKNNFRGHDISQGLDREPPSLSPHFLLAKEKKRQHSGRITDHMRDAKQGRLAELKQSIILSELTFN